MATRPLFLPTSDGRVMERQITFVWQPGMSLSQKRKCIASMHSQAEATTGCGKLLEVSTKSPDRVGASLSAMNLLLSVPSSGRVPVECAFQGSKVFDTGGPFSDLYTAAPRDAKRDQRLTTSGRLIAFRLNDVGWPLEPKSVFYDWLYLTALCQQPELATCLVQLGGFTDIEFNPSRSYSTQARSCALYVALANTSRLREAMECRDAFLKAVRTAYQEGQHPQGQPRLW